MIIGITGSMGSGKEIVSNFLKEKGFVYFSLSNEIREIAKQRGIELTRKNLQDLGDELRQTHGSEALAKIVIEKIKTQNHSKAVIDSIRNPAEVIELKKVKDFFLISVDAPLIIRFNRIVGRNRSGDSHSWEEFIKADTRDKGLHEPETGQGVAKCIEQADFILVNDKTIEEINQQLKEIYSKINQINNSTRS